MTNDRPEYHVFEIRCKGDEGSEMVSYLISLNPLFFVVENIAYNGSFKHSVFVFVRTGG